MGSPTDKHPPDPPVKAHALSRYGRFKQNIRISMNMLRAVYYVGRTGISHGSPELYWRTVYVIASMFLMEFFYWVMSKRISEFYSMVSNVAADPNCNFYWFLAQFALAAVGYAAIRGLEAYLKGLYSMSLRRAITDWFQSLYFERLRLTSPQSPPSIDNCDQRLTDDIKAVSDAFIQVYGTLLIQPPLVVIHLIYSYTLVTWAPIIIVTYFVFSAVLLRTTMNPILKHRSRAEKAEADLRLVHVLAKNRAEPIAISDGGQRIRADADSKFDACISIQTRLNRLFSLNAGMNGLLQYANSVWAYFIVFSFVKQGSMPPSKDLAQASSFMAGRLMNVMMKMSSINDLFHSLPLASAHAFRLIELARRLEFAAGPETGNGMQEVVVSTSVPATRSARRRSSSAFFEAVSVCFEGVDLFSPDEQLLVYGFSVKIWPGHNTIIHGPSGSGKSSLIRCLTGIWKCRHGSASVIAPLGLTRPPIMYAPQTSIVVSGTILDQLYYPHPPPIIPEDPDALDELKDLVRQCLQAVSMFKLYTARLHGSLSQSRTCSEWYELMSPGELQRLVLARFFLHRPVFAFLDEATNAIDACKETEIYELLWAAGITTISVSHRTGFVKDSASIAIFLDGQGNHQIEQK